MTFSEAEHSELANYQVNSIDEWAEQMGKDNSMQFVDYKSGWFTVHKKCVVGKDMINWVIEKVELDYSKA